MFYKQLQPAGQPEDDEGEPSQDDYELHVAPHVESTKMDQLPTEQRFFKSANALHTAISVAAGTVMCLFGYEQGVFGGIIVGQDFLEYFHDPSPSMQGFVTSVYDLGCFGGAVLTLFVGEKLGRKRMLIIFTIM